MPIYEYTPSSTAQCDHCRNGFEKLQRIDAAALNCCPECQAPCQRCISAPNINRSDTTLEKKNIEQHGFTQYKKAGKGVYEKTAGKGPPIISTDD